MDETLADMVERAETLFASDRMEKLTTIFDEIRQLIPDKDYWYFDVYFKLYKAVTKDFGKLLNAVRQGGDNLSEVSWRCRNLLELSVWLLHFKENRDNAWRFYEDAAKDGSELINKLQAYGIKNLPEDTEWLEKMGEVKDVLGEKATALGISDIEGKYLDVKTVAKSTIIADHFSMLYKKYSKFAHPTAFAVINDADIATLTAITNGFYVNGCNCFNYCIEMIEYPVYQLYESLLQDSTKDN